MPHFYAFGLSSFFLREGALFLAVEAPFGTDVAPISKMEEESYCCLYLHRGSRWLDLPQLNPEPVAVQQLSCQRDKTSSCGQEVDGHIWSKVSFYQPV